MALGFAARQRLGLRRKIEKPLPADEQVGDDAASSQHMSTTTTERALIFHSTRISRSLAQSCHPGSEESSPFRKSVACITATNVSPPDRFQFQFAKCCATAVPRRLRIAR